jgi:hypothetical protein
MAQIGNVVVDFSTDTTQWTKGVNKVKSDMDGLKGKSDGLMKQLQNSFGRGSTLKESMEILAGGGVVAGLHIAGKQLEGMTSKALELRDAIASGKMEASQLVDELMKSVPIIGGFWAAGRNIRELLTGEGAGVAQTNRETEAMNKLLELQREQVRASKEYIRTQTEKRDNNYLEIGILTSRNKLEKEYLQIGLQRRNEIRAVEQATEDEIRKDQALFNQKFYGKKDAKGNIVEPGKFALADQQLKAAEAMMDDFHIGEDYKQKVLAEAKAQMKLVMDEMDKERAKAISELDKDGKLMRGKDGNVLYNEKSEKGKAFKERYESELAKAKMKYQDAVKRETENIQEENQARQDSINKMAREIEVKQELMTLMENTTDETKLKKEQQAIDLREKKTQVLLDAESERVKLEEQLQQYKFAQNKYSATKDDMGFEETKTLIAETEKQLKLLDSSTEQKLDQLDTADKQLTTEQEITEQLRIRKQLQEDVKAFAEGQGGPLGAYKKEVDRLTNLLVNGGADKNQIQNALADAQGELRDQLNQNNQYQQNQNTVRRFNFGRAYQPTMADPIKDLVTVNKNTEKNTAETARQTKQANEKTKELLEKLKVGGI